MNRRKSVTFTYTYKVIAERTRASVGFLICGRGPWFESWQGMADNKHGDCVHCTKICFCAGVYDGIQIQIIKKGSLIEGIRYASRTRQDRGMAWPYIHYTSQ